MKRRTRALLALYFGFVVYSFSVLIWGQSGAVATASISAYRTKLESNLNGLQQTNAHLTRIFNNLQSNPATITLEARQLGYLAPGDRPIDISGYTEPDVGLSVGTILSPYVNQQPSDSLFRIFGLASALIFYALSGIVFGERRGSIRNRFQSQTSAR